MVYKPNVLIFQIVGTKDILSDIQKFLIKYLNLKKTKLTNNIKWKNHFALRYCHALDIFNWLYSGADYYLNRKYNKYLQLKEEIEHEGCNISGRTWHQALAVDKSDTEASSASI